MSDVSPPSRKGSKRQSRKGSRRSVTVLPMGQPRPRVVTPGLPEADLEPVVKKMIFWRRFSFGLTLFLVTVGMLLALLYVGSYDSEKQTRYVSC